MQGREFEELEEGKARKGGEQELRELGQSFYESTSSTSASGWLTLVQQKLHGLRNAPRHNACGDVRQVVFWSSHQREPVRTPVLTERGPTGRQGGRLLK